MATSAGPVGIKLVEEVPGALYFKITDTGVPTYIEDMPEPVLGTKTITENDTYSAEDDELDGYSSVTVNVPAPVYDASLAVGSGEAADMTAGSNLTYTITTTDTIASGTVLTVTLSTSR